MRHTVKIKHVNISYAKKKAVRKFLNVRYLKNVWIMVAKSIYEII